MVFRGGTAFLGAKPSRLQSVLSVFLVCLLYYLASSAHVNANLLPSLVLRLKLVLLWARTADDLHFRRCCS